MNEFKKDLINYLKKIPKDPNIVSVSLVGSFVDKEKFGMTEDVDIVVVFKWMTANSFIKLKDYLEDICNNLSNDKRYVYPAIISGPVKPKLGSRQTFMLHVLLGSHEKFEERWSKPLIIDWMYKNIPIKGLKIRDLVKFRNFNKKDLLEGNDGLKFVKSIITSRKMSSSIYLVKKGKLIKRRWKRAVQGKEAAFEILQYVVIVSLLNVARLNNPKFKKEENSLLIYAQKNLPKKYADIVKKMYKIKKDFKETGKLDFDQKLLEKRVTDFLDYLIKSV